jgi:hypothetical protein
MSTPVRTLHPSRRAFRSGAPTFALAGLLTYFIFPYSYDALVPVVTGQTGCFFFEPPYLWRWRLFSPSRWGFG